METAGKADMRAREEPAELSERDSLNSKHGNSMDRANMFRMGKVQEMRRNFRFVSIFGFSMILMASWEAALRAPTSGGQYHLVSEFAPREHQKILSYLMGWMCVMGWQALCASTAYVAGTQIQGLVVMAYPDTYIPEKYHGTLLTMACAAFSVFFNTVLSRKLPLVEGIVLVIHLLAFVGVLVALWVFAPKSEASVVFTTFTDGGGWGNIGASTLVGVVSGALPLLGADAAVHMSEEIRDASRTLPKAMIWSTIVNGALGWIMVITFCVCLGDLEGALATPTGHPFMQVFLDATRDPGSAIAMSAFVAGLSLCTNITMVATASRQLFAFARDRAVPFTGWFSKVRPGWDVPANSIFTTFLLTSLLSLINIGSPVALTSITSLSTTSLISTYITSIGCIIWRRVTGAPMLKSSFVLGRLGLAINIISELFLIIVLGLAFMPPTPNPSPELMNWNLVIYGAAMIISFVYFFFRGRHRYEGPVAYVRQLE